MSERPYTAAEVAEKLGHSADWLYRHYDTLVAHHGLPPRLYDFGRYRFHRRAVDAFIAARRNPAFDAAPANDALPPLTLDAERAALALHYGAH